jgi:hypothetical protein
VGEGRGEGEQEQAPDTAIPLTSDL